MAYRRVNWSCRRKMWGVVDETSGEALETESTRRTGRSSSRLPGRGMWNLETGIWFAAGHASTFGGWSGRWRHGDLLRATIRPTVGDRRLGRF